LTLHYRFSRFAAKPALPKAGCCRKEETDLVHHAKESPDESELSARTFSLHNTQGKPRMINRIREIRKAKAMTLAELAEACDPPTTAQTIGRLETGTRTLSINWMDRIGTALDVDPEVLVRSDSRPRAQVVAALGMSDVEALSAPREAVLPTEIVGSADQHLMLVIEVNAAVGEYRPGDLIWLRQIQSDEASVAANRAINRDCLVPRPGGRFTFGRLIDCKGTLVGILPSQSGQKQQVVDAPPWIAVATMLVRSL
jgi:transcriptional regulator with XRE-family HTH domain